MKLLFLNPPSLTEDNVIRDCIYGCWCKGKRIGGAMTPPYPLLILATVMQEDGIEVAVIDALAEENMTFPQVEEIVKEYDFLVLLTSVMTFSEDKEILARLKQANPSLKTIVYGSLPTFMPEFALKAESVDFIIRHEAEFALRDFIRLYESGSAEWKKVPGIGFRESGTPVINEQYPFIENLDSLPFVDWSLLKNSNRYFNPSIMRYPYVTDLTARGCPGKCTFCMAPAFYGNQVRGRSAEHVIEGIRRFAKMGYKEIYFRDELFTAFRERNQKICQAIIEEGIDISWLCSAKVGTIKREDVDLMHRAGCHTLKIGVESGVQEVLNKMKKGIRLEHTRELFAYCNEVGMRTHAHCMIGNVGDTPETIKRTIDFARELNPTTVTFGILTPYPGTPIFNLVVEKHPELKDNYNLQLHDLHVTSFYSDAFCSMAPEELSKWSKKAHQSFYLRPAYVISWLKRIRTVDDLMRVTKAGLKVIDYAIRGE